MKSRPSNSQLNFFDRLTGDDVSRDVGIVYRLGNGYWQAEIGNGWWVAQAKTERGAIRAVIKRYEDERDKGR